MKAVLGYLPFLAGGPLDDEAMADMPVHGEAGSTEDNILADEALINILILLNFCEFTAITIVIVGHTHLLGDFLVHLLGLLLA